MNQFDFMKKNFRVVCLLALLLTVRSVWSATVTNIAVPSPAMKKDISVTVILPKVYHLGGAHLPVLYLLHGYSDNNQTWAAGTSIKELADQYGIIVVCPDGGYSSWYFDSPVDSVWRYETFMAKELVAYVDGHYQTLPKRESRAITGQSMGGHGAMFLSIRHPDVFSVVGCLSGGVDLRPFPDQWDIAKRLGNFKDFPDRWSSNSVITLASNLPPGGLAISIDCGADDFFITVNRSLHQLLLTRKVPHDYTERPGGHNWEYWSNAVKYQMLFISNHLTR